MSSYKVIKKKSGLVSNEMRKNHGSNAISYLLKVGREGALSTEGVGRKGDGGQRGR